MEFKTVNLFQKFAQSLKPRPQLLVSDWADAYRRLAKGTSAEPGRWNTARAEYQREIMNAVNDPNVSDIAVKSSAQVGKTEILLNIIGYFIEYEPATILVVNPTVEMSQTFSKDRLAPMIAATPELKSKVKEPRTKDSENTILHKKYPGGHITMAGANSPASLASRPVCVVIMDEVDRFPASAGSEGSPIKLAEKRTTSFWNKKKIKVSTPTVEGFSEIEKEFQKGTMEEWNTQCPFCKKYQPYEFKRIHFSTLMMECQYCKEKLSERDWHEQPHKWIAAHPERTGYRSFHMNELASPWSSWETIVNEFREANEEVKKHGSVEKLKTFVNTVLGETWEERGDGADENDLLKRREPYQAEVPDGVLLITAGVDTQDDRLEVEICGWGIGYESWGLRKFVIRGDPALDSTWDTLESMLCETSFFFANGNELNIAATCIDTGGHHTNQVYKFIRKMEKQHKNIFGIKGYANTPGIPLIYKRTKVEIKNAKGKVVDSTHIMILGVDAGKEDIVSWLNVKDVGPRYCHFPCNKELGYDETYFKGLTSEEKVTKMVKNKLKIQWVKKSGVRNEPLDLRNYAYAAVELLSPNWQLLAKKVEAGINYMKAGAKTKKKRHRGVANKGIEV